MRTAYRLVSGLAGEGTVSIESCDSPGTFFFVPGNLVLQARANDGSQAFAEAASFIQRNSEWFPNYAAFESLAHKDHFIRHQNYLLKANTGNDQLFKADASFKLTEAKEAPKTVPLDTCFRIFAQNFPENSWDRQGRASRGPDSFKFTAALSGTEGAVSMVSCEENGKVLRAAQIGGEWRIVLTASSDIASDNDKMSASFRIAKNKFLDGFLAFESLLRPNNFVRHQGFVLKVNPLDESSIYEADASWSLVGRPPSPPPPAPPASPPVSNGVTNKYDFSKQDANVIKDTIGKNDLKINGAAKFSSGVYGEAFLFDGKTSLSSTDKSVGLPAPFTLTFWVKPTAKQEMPGILNLKKSNQKFLIVPDVDNTGKELSVSVGVNGINVFAGTKGIISLRRAEPEWTAVAVVARKTGPVDLYVNGVLAGRSVQSSNTPLVLRPFSVGGGGLGDGTQIAGQFFEGALDNFRVYNRYVNADQLVRLYQAEDQSRSCFFTRSKDIPSAGWTVDGTLMPNSNSLFRLVPGLAGEGTVSIESCQRPGFYFMDQGDAPLRLVQFNANADFARRASYFQREGLYAEGYDAFETFGTAGRYIWHRGNKYGRPSLVSASPADVQPFELSFRRVYPERDVFKPQCDGINGWQDEVVRLNFDEGRGLETLDTQNRRKAALQNSVKWVVGKVGSALQFDATDDEGKHPSVFFNSYSPAMQGAYTLSMWVKPDPTVSMTLYSPKLSGVAWKGARFLVFPEHGTTLPYTNAVGLGIAVAANGVSIFAHTDNFLAPLLTYRQGISGWTQLIIAVEKNTPKLYVNGKLVKAEVAAGIKYNVLYQLRLLGAPDVSNEVGYKIAKDGYVGILDEYTVFDRAFTNTDAANLYAQENPISANKCDQTAQYEATSLSCDKGQVIHTIEYASYGKPTGDCGSFVTDDSCHSEISEIVLAQQCIGKQQCDVTINNALFGDPCRGVVDKRLHAEWTCRPKEVHESVNLCGQNKEHTGTTEDFLKCPEGRVISSIEFASWGTPGGQCGKFSINSNCHAINSKEVVENMCLGKQSCFVSPDNSIFGDPCDGIEKTLKVQYSCRKYVLPVLRCAEGVDRDKVPTQLLCPGQQVISEIFFASYGQPSGTCGAYELEGTCHSQGADERLRKLCVGQKSCSVQPATYTDFFAPLNDAGCKAGAGRQLRVTFACSHGIPGQNSCREITKCEIGEEEVAKPTTSSDRVCQKCAKGTFRSSLWDQSRPCEKWTECLSGQYASKAPTATSDRECLPLNPCKSGSYIEQDASPTSDFVCAKCSQCSSGQTPKPGSCKPDGTSDTQCNAACVVCTKGQYLKEPCAANSPGKCASCSSNVCPLGQFLSGPCTSKGDRSCTPWRSCNPSTEYETNEPTATRDRVCAKLTVCSANQFESLAPTSTSDRECSFTRECKPGSIETSAPTPTSDRQCKPCAAGTADTAKTQISCEKCQPGQFVPPGQTSCEGQICVQGTTDDDSSAATECAACDGKTGFMDVRGNIGKCKPVTICPPGAFVKTEATPFSDRVCVGCVLGKTYADKQGKCTPVTECGAGEEETTAPTVTSNRVCSKCDVGTFKAGSGDGKCRPVTVCAAGEGETVRPTPTSNRKCASCELGKTFNANVGSGTCKAITSCTAGSQYISKRATLTSDRVCAAVSSCTLGATYEARAPTSTTDRECQPCTRCPDSSPPVSSCTLTADAKCTNCGPTCTKEQFQEQACSAGVPRVCTSCSKCVKNEFISKPCSGRADTVCSPVTKCKPGQQYAVAPATLSSDALCKAIRKCVMGKTYQIRAPTATSDRKCAPVTPSCPGGKIEASAPTLTSDRVCKSCPAGQSYQSGKCITCGSGTFAPAGSLTCNPCEPGTIDVDGDATTPCEPCPEDEYQPKAGMTLCKPTTLCKAGEEMTTAATSTRDRTCRACTLGSTYNPKGGQGTSCMPVKPCDAGTFEATAATVTANPTCEACATGTFSEGGSVKACQAWTPCRPGQDLIRDGSNVADNVCRDCPSGSWDDDGNPRTACAVCPSDSTYTTPTGNACVSLCGADQSEKTRPTSISDRTCVDNVYVEFTFVGDLNAVRAAPNGIDGFKYALLQALAARPSLAENDFGGIEFSDAGGIKVRAAAKGPEPAQSLRGILGGGLFVRYNGLKYEVKRAPTPINPTATAAPSGGDTTPAASGTGSGGTGANAGLIGGLAAAGVIIVAVIIGGAIFYRRRRTGGIGGSSMDTQASFTNPMYSNAEFNNMHNGGEDGAGDEAAYQEVTPGDFSAEAFDMPATFNDGYDTGLGVGGGSVVGDSAYMDITPGAFAGGADDLSAGGYMEVAGLHAEEEA